MNDRLKLTEADIEQSSPETRLTISHGDLPPEPRTVVQTAVIRITHDDLTAQPAHNQSPPIYQLEMLMWQLINEERQLQTFPRLLRTAGLHWHEDLAQVARLHSQDMLERHYVEHTSPEGVTAVQRNQRAGISFMASGENIGVVYGSNSQSEDGIYDIHRAFMDQPRGRVNNHRGNLLNPFWTHVGVGIARSPHGALFATQNFISTL